MKAEPIPAKDPNLNRRFHRIRIRYLFVQFYILLLALGLTLSGFYWSQQKEDVLACGVVDEPFTCGTMGYGTESKIFISNCASCHKWDKRSVGPALHGSLERWRGDWQRMQLYLENEELYHQTYPDDRYAQDMDSSYQWSWSHRIELTPDEWELLRQNFMY